MMLKNGFNKRKKEEIKGPENRQLIGHGRDVYLSTKGRHPFTMEKIDAYVTK